MHQSSGRCVNRKDLIDLANKSSLEKKTGGILGAIERVGNALPSPFILFVWLVVILIVLTAVLAAFGVSAVNPTTGETVAVQSLLTRDGLVWILGSLVTNFSGFAALGIVLLMQMAIGVTEASGLLHTAVRRAVLGVPTWALTAVVIFIGINGSIASEASIVFIPPLAAAAFFAAGKHPLAGLIAGYAATNAGFTANVMITSTDALLYGVTQEAAQTIDPNYTTSPANNWYFMIASCFVLTIVGTLVNDHIIEPRLGKYTGTEVDEARDATPLEKKALRNAGIFTLIYIAIILIGLIPKNGILRAEDGSIIKGPFVTGLVPFLLAYFVIVGIVYGFTVGTFKKVDDIPRVMAESLTSLTGYIVLVFVIAQFIAIFNYTNLAMVVAVNAAAFLDTIGLTGVPLILAILIVTTFVNFFMTSGTAKWYIFAPIFVPMFMMLGFAPEFAQAVYRIADSCTNPITPIYPYLPMVIGMAAKYDKKFGMGNVISMMIPYSFGFLIVWTIFVILWMFLDLPLGPGAFVYLQ